MNKSGTSGQVISHPQGGGAIQGIGDTFSPDLHTGTGNLSVPIAVPGGRNGMHPELALVYSSGQGNGPYGLGWSLSVPGVTRDTSKRVPVYDDDIDVFLLSGSEQLVPVSSPAPGSTGYRPRTEKLFARITHITSPTDDCWEARTRNGLVNRYGTPGHRGNDPAVVRDPDRGGVFAWRLTQTVDPFGNRIEYVYEREPAQESGPHRWDQIYLKTIRYVDYGSADNRQFLLTVDFFYEKRPDPFSNYKAGFEIRTTQRCSRIEVSTHADASRVARIYRFEYADAIDPGAAAANGSSILRRITVEGVDGEVREALPPLDFLYTGFDPRRRVYQPMSAPSGPVPERSLAHPDFELADLFGRGLPDVVQIGDTARYWRNLGHGRFDVPRPIEGLPPGVRLGDSGAQLGDFDGDGHVDLLLPSVRGGGYVPLTVNGQRSTGRVVQYRAAPPFALNDPELRLVDLDGDGITDALRTGTQIELYFHDRYEGWTHVETRTRDDFDRFPDVHFSDPRVKLADMSGDGLQDIVFVDRASVSYWPSLGYGRWGARVEMSGRIEFPDALSLGGIGFDPRRVLLGDVDGDGVSDLVYVESGRVTVWLNQSGNGWSDPIVIHGTPPLSDVDSVRLADMLGTGTEGILWSYDFGTFRDSTYKFLDLCGGLKPYLLCERNNNAGARILVEYAPSTESYLADQVDPRTRWQTRLPFAVQVVSRVESIDQISGGKLTTEYRYHQGYWDGEEREFRGFGAVEQLDTETFDRYHAAGLHGAQTFNAVDAVHFSPPTLTRTWFHQGMVVDQAGTLKEPDPAPTFFPGDQPFFGPQQRVNLAALARTAAVNAEPTQLRHALRALRGSILRTELYALDGTPRADRPYSVTEALYDVREVEPFAPGTEQRLRIFFPFERAQRTTQWERGQEPMTQLSFGGDPDAYGLPTGQLSIAVPRGRDPSVALTAPPPEPYLSTYATTEYAQRDDAAVYMVDRVARSTSSEVLSDGSQAVLSLRDGVFQGSGALRVIGHTRTYYDGDAFVGLPLGTLGAFGAPVRSESLAFADSFLDELFNANDPLAVSSRPVLLDPHGVTAWPPEYPAEFQALVPALGGYVHYGASDVPGSPGGYYAIAQRQRYDFHDPARTARGLLLASSDALEAEASVDYDRFDFLPVHATDAVGLVTAANYDLRILQPSDITDPNGNVASFAFSPAGLLSAQSVRGKNGEGDAAHPSVTFTYDLLAFRDRGQPISVRTTRRVHHDSETDVLADQRDDTIASVEYSDGFGRLLQTRTQAEDVLFGDPVFGGTMLAADQSAPVAPTVGRARAAGAPDNVVVSGWQTYDNKGRVIEKYEPFYGQGYDFAAPQDPQLGQKATIFYDPRGHAVRTVNPDGSEQRVVLGVPPDLTNPDAFTPTPWEAYTYDANDNAGRTHAVAAAAYQSHWNTPASAVVDALGRTISAIARNGPDPAKDWFVTRSAYDIQGNLLSVTDALARVAFRYVFDLAKRRWRSDSIDGGRGDVVPDALGNPVEARDSKGALTLSAYDLAHRPARAWARDDGAGTVTLRQRLEYGDGGRPDQPAADRAAASAQNLLGQMTRHHDEAGRTTVASVDFKGNVIDKSRQVIADAPILAAFEGAAARNWQVTPFQVDWQPGTGEALGDREAALLDPTVYHTTSSFDALNRVKRAQLPAEVGGQRRELLPQYNRGGALERVSFDGTVYVDRIAYDAKGQRALVAYGSGVMTRYAYDPQTFRLKRLRSEGYKQTDSVAYTPAGTVLQDFGYEYDLVGNILTLHDRTPGSGIPGNPEAHDRAFSYDPIYRLLSATGREYDRTADPDPWDGTPRGTDVTRTRVYTEHYTYDAAGGVMRLDHRSPGSAFVRQFTVETTNNRLQTMAIGQSTYAYAFDPSGNLTSETTSRHFEWNQANQMKVFRTQTAGAEPSVHAHYLYDGAGQRVKKLVRKQGGAIETTQYIDGAFEHARWSAGGGGQNNHLHVMDGVHRVAIVRVGAAQPEDRGPAVQVHLADHLGSSNVVLDGAGALVNREEFTPYGETSFGSFARKRYRFTGKERDEESGATYHNARFYIAWLQRWASCDPASASTHSYQYGRNSPFRYIDPRGEEDKDTDTVQSKSKPKSTVPDKLQELADEYLEPALNRNLGEGPSAFGTRLHDVLQKIIESHEFNWPGVEKADRLVLEMIIDENGRILDFGKKPGGAPKGSVTVDIAVLKKGLTSDSPLIGKKAADVLAAGIDYKTGNGKLKSNQVKFFERIQKPLYKLTAGGDLARDMASLCRAERSPAGGGGRPRSVSAGEPSVGWEADVSKALNWFFYISFIAEFSHAKTMTEAMGVVTKTTGAYLAVELGLEYCAPGGPEAAAACATLAAVFGPKVVEDPKGFMQDAVDCLFGGVCPDSVVDFMSPFPKDLEQELRRRLH
jgi:RHS repeat-associated protein